LHKKYRLVLSFSKKGKEKVILLLFVIQRKQTEMLKIPISKILIIFLLLLSVVGGCKTSKQSKNQKITTVLLDTIEIIRSKDDLYRASETKVNDMQHMKLKVRFDFEKQYLYGNAALTFAPHFYPTSKISLDAKGMEIRSVKTLLGKELTYSYDSLKLLIDLDREYKGGEKYTIVIDYIAKPNERKTGGSRAISSDKGLYFINPLGKEPNKPRQIWTQGETESNSVWFPCIDKPNQKTTQEIEITVEDKYKTLSNGLLIKSEKNSDGTRTDFWKQDLPNAPYLVMMAIGEYDITKDKWREKELSYFMEPEYKEVAKKIFGVTVEMMELYSKQLGVDFPWEKYAQVVVRDYVSGAMENTSATVHGEFVQRTNRQLIDEKHEDIIAHELYHQWFGDLVTCESWSNIPLNESFATYGEYLWNEHKNGKLYADWKQQRSIRGYFNESKNRKNVNLIRFYYDDKEDVFDAHSYNKGGAILHMLRNVVGDEAFFASLGLYLKKNAYKTVEIHDLRLAFEEVTGRDMNNFFNQWFLQNGHPVLDIKYGYDEDSVYVEMTQKHNTDNGQIFNLPMKINVHYKEVVMSYPVVFKYAKQKFAFPSMGLPSLIDADAERVLLCEKKENKKPEQYKFQYKNHTLLLAKTEALDALKGQVGKDTASNMVFERALNEPQWILRKEAIKKLRSDSTVQAVFLGKIKEMAQKDASSSVRQEALEYLGATKKKDLANIYINALNDSSYRCVSQALNGLFEIDSVYAFEKAKGLVSEPEMELKNSSYSILSKKHDDALNVFFQEKVKQETGYIKTALYYHYANYLTHCDSSIVLSGIKFLFDYAQENENSKSNVKNSIKRVNDYVQKRSDFPAKEFIKKESESLLEKMKKGDE
jgi:aminopeptidase N